MNFVMVELLVCIYCEVVGDVVGMLGLLGGVEIGLCYVWEYYDGSGVL